MFESNSAEAQAAAAERAAELQAATDGHVRRRPSSRLPPCGLPAPSPSPGGSRHLREGLADATAGRACADTRPALRWQAQYGQVVDGHVAPPRALEPKVLVPHQPGPGRAPRKIVIERQKRLFALQDVH